MSNRTTLGKLRKIATTTRERTLVAREDNRQKKEAKKCEVNKKDIPDLLFCCGQKQEKVLNSIDVQGWFRDGMEKLYGKTLTLPKNEWAVKERKNAKRLLEMYGEALTKKAVLHFCQYWNEYVANSNGRLFGKPTVNLLWAMREPIYADAELGKKPGTRTKKNKRDAAEWVEGKRDIGLGW